MGFITKIFGGGGEKPVAPVAAQKPISPVTSRTTTEATQRRRRRSLATEGQGRSLLNEPTEPLG